MSVGGGSVPANFLELAVQQSPHVWTGDDDERACHLAAMGWSYREIAEDLNCSHQAVWLRINSEPNQKRLASYRQEVQTTALVALQGCGLTAVATLRELCDSAEDEETRRKAANDLLSHLEKLGGHHASLSAIVNNNRIEITLPGNDRTSIVHELGDALRPYN